MGIIAFAVDSVFIVCAVDSDASRLVVDVVGTGTCIDLDVGCVVVDFIFAVARVDCDFRATIDYGIVAAKAVNHDVAQGVFDVVTAVGAAQIVFAAADALDEDHAGIVGIDDCLR